MYKVYDITIDVQNSRIAIGVKGDATACPLARAIVDELLPVRWSVNSVEVGGCAVRIGNRRCWLPSNGAEFVGDYDAGKFVKPTKIILHTQDEFLAARFKPDFVATRTIE